MCVCVCAIIGVEMFGKKIVGRVCGRRLFSSERRSVETWEEVERNRPTIPTLEGYRRPARAPQQQDIPRDEFHRFMMGKAPKVPEQWRAFVGGFVLFSWCIGACAFTMYKLRPDDFEWLEEERNKAEAAKARISKKLEMVKSS